mmetsp:Transcript_7745/g.13174  ORF Transcript_7745/g.13174 Transcript_7745/m.13174 type:complete len:223 (-) Transcript_7745:82-750(-)
MLHSISYILFTVLFMGQIFRIMSYDRAANERNAIQGLKVLDKSLKWHRLDDGVMGGQSETLHSFDGVLNFSGHINCNGGGFTSIRSAIPGGLSSDATGVRVTYVGDGKTYKVLFSDGNKSAFGPSRRSPSWQTDLPTKEGIEETTTISFESLTPSLQGGPVDTDAKLDPTQIQEMGFMLSLKLSSGKPNPVETYGSGIFPFSLKIKNIEPVSGDCSAETFAT